MSNLPQNLNQGRYQDIGATNDGLNAALTGSTNDAVLLFAAANEAVQGPASYTTITNSAADGTSILLQKKGVYEITLGAAHLAAASALVLGISQDATDLITDILITDTGALAATSVITNTTNLGFAQLKVTAFVSPQQEVAGTTIRFHGSTADGVPTAMLALATTYYKIQWVADNQI